MEQQNNKTDETAGRPELTQEQICSVDAILRCWAKAGTCLLRRDGDPTMAGGKVRWTVPVDGLVRMLHTLAHCAALSGMQDLVTGRSDGNHGPDMAIGFIAAAKAVEYLGVRSGMTDVKLCSADPHEYLRETWNEIEKSRESVVADIERLAPGWYAKVQELAAKANEEPTVDPPESAVGHVVPPDDEYAGRVARAKSGIRRKELGEIRIDNVVHRLYVHLDEPQELLRWNYNDERAKIKTELSKTWMTELVTFIGEYEGRYGERLSDNEIRYLRELVSGEMSTDRRRGYIRLIGLEKRDTSFRPDGLGNMK